MAEEEETSAGVGLLSRLFGSLGLWRPAGDAETETETETAETKTETEAEAGGEWCTVPGTTEEERPPCLDSPGMTEPESESRPESSRPAESESIAARVSNSPADRLDVDSDADAENPHNIFGLHTASKPKPSPPAEPLRPAKGKGSKRKTKGRQPGGRDGGTTTEPRRPAKKPPMRTARDVISRIQWDRNLPEDYFDIGYLDRFLGVVEKPFASFTWGDLPWQEYDVLAIPQHRIQYFSYRGVKVWEKSERFDAVFGSAGTSEVIEEAMTRIDAEVEAKREAEAQARLAGTWQVGREGEEGEEGVFSDDSDDEDGVCVEVPAAVPAGVQGVPEEERSTHFLAVRVTSPAVRAGAARVQNSVVQHDVSLSACTMRTELLHITMCMMRLEDGEAIAAAGRCLRETISELRETLRGDDRALRMRGLRTFGARVLYSPVAPCVSFCTAVELLRTRLDALPGVRLTNAFDYVPHLTLLKVSRPVARARRSKFIDAAGYAGMERDDLGEQRFDNIHLCAIDADCALDGFYVTEASVTF